MQAYSAEFEQMSAYVVCWNKLPNPPPYACTVRLESYSGGWRGGGGLAPGRVTHAG
jgi:hypothetical protein